LPVNSEISYRVAVGAGLLCSLLIARSLFAGEPSGTDDFSFYSRFDTGIGGVDEDLFVLLLAEQGFRLRHLTLSLSGPFRLRVLDNAPDDARVLREQDFDEPSDWARILRAVDYRREWEDAVALIHLGELNDVQIGHGTVVSHYFNSMDMDHYQGGALLSVDVRGNGLEFFMQDVVAPAIIGGRAHVAPFSFFSQSPWGRRFQVALSLLTDTGVPHRTMVDGRRFILIAGGDAGLLLVDQQRFSLEARVDVLGCDGSAGVHGGLAAGATLSQERELTLQVSGEYRYAGEDYYPALINPFYDRNRRSFSRDPVTGLRNTFAEHLANTAIEGSDSHGFAVDLSLQMADRFRIGARYDFQSDHRPHWLLFKMELAPVQRFSLRAFFAGQDIAGGAGIFSSESLVGLSLHVELIGPLRAFTEVVRRHRRVGDGPARTANEISGGVGLVFSY